MSEPTFNTPGETVSSAAKTPTKNSGKKFAYLGVALAVVIAGGSVALYKADPSHARKHPTASAVAQNTPAKPIVAPVATPPGSPLPAAATAVQVKPEAPAVPLSATGTEKPALPESAAKPIAQVAPTADVKPAKPETKPADEAQPAAEKTPALTISDMEIEPIDALEHGTYKVSGKIVNPDAKKKIELTAIHALLKDKNGATVQDVSLDLPVKRIMAPGEVRDFSYTVTAKDPSIVRLEVAVDLLR